MPLVLDIHNLVSNVLKHQLTLNIPKLVTVRGAPASVLGVWCPMYMKYRGVPSNIVGIYQVRISIVLLEVLGIPINLDLAYGVLVVCFEVLLLHWRRFIGYTD